MSAATIRDADATRRPTVREIQQAVAAEFRLPLVEMESARRARDVARARQIAMWLARELTPLSLPQIGRRFGGRHHTTVMHACEVAPQFIAQDAMLAFAVDAVRARVLAT